MKPLIISENQVQHDRAVSEVNLVVKEVNNLLKVLKEQTGYIPSIIIWHFGKIFQ